MLSQYIRIKNRSEYRRVIEDSQLPGGRIILDPGEETSIRREVYARIARRHSHWLLNLDSPSAGAIEEAVEKEETEKDEIFIETVKSLLPKLEQETEKPEVDLTTWTLSELKDLASARGVKYKVGMSKADLIEAIRNAPNQETGKEQV